jgi:hypothetical protein
MSKGKKTPVEVSASIMAALLAGQGVNEVSREFKVPQPTVSVIKARMEEQFNHFNQKKDISVQILELLETQLDALKNIAAAVGRPEYLEKQPASETAVLYGVISDKAFRIVSALSVTQAEHVEAPPELQGDTAGLN